MGIHEEISKRVRELRTKRDMTQQELADSAGISPNFLNRIENRREQASIETIEHLAKALGVSPASLLADLKATSNDDENDIARIAIAYHKLSVKQKKTALPLVINLLKTLKDNS